MEIPSGQLGAIALVQGTGSLKGTVKFYPVPRGTLVAAEFAGLPDNGLCYLRLHSHVFLPMQGQKGRVFLAVETPGMQAWDLVGKTVALSLGSAQGVSIGSGQVCEP